MIFHHMNAPLNQIAAAQLILTNQPIKLRDSRYFSLHKLIPPLVSAALQLAGPHNAVAKRSDVRLHINHPIRS
ncbi:hypothetical protein D3C84_1002260 [compost metagenome]